MKRVLIITSHYPPSNLTGVHRARLFAKYLPQFDWEPIILTVDEQYYEENLDVTLSDLLPKNQQIIRVKAFPVTSPRIIGDIGLRAFFQLRKKASEIIKKKQIDFVFIILPSFYLALLGPWLSYLHKCKYGIDYIDPWVHNFQGYKKIFSRHWWSTHISKILEPIAISKCSLITSVAEKYYLPVFDRNPNLHNRVNSVAIPYGWDKGDIEVLIESNAIISVPRKKSKIKLIYPGVFLPNSRSIFKMLCQSIRSNIDFFSNVELHFVGTANSKVNQESDSIKAIASQYEIYDSIIFESPQRLDYKDLLLQITDFDGIFILGSSESHYSPSKLFLSFGLEKPLFAILHEESNAIGIIENSGLGLVCKFSNKLSLKEFDKIFFNKIVEWVIITQSNKWKINHSIIDEYSALSLTKKLAHTFNNVV